MTNDNKDQRNWIERLTAHIPGYGGYVEKETRRDTDKLHREHLANELRRMKQPVTNALRELTDNGRIMEVAPLDRIIKKLDRVENRVRFAAYGYAGFFDVVKIREEQLKMIYDFDLRLSEHVAKLSQQADAVAQQSGSSETLKPVATEFERAIDEFDRLFDKRFSFVNTYDNAAAQTTPPSFMG